MAENNNESNKTSENFENENTTSENVGQQASENAAKIDENTENENGQQTLRSDIQAVRQTPNDLGARTKEQIAKQSITHNSFRQQAKYDIEQVKQSYMEKEGRLFQAMKPQSGNRGSSIAQDYENILLDNLAKLKEVAKNDLKNSEAQSKKLTEETKKCLHDFVVNAFNAADSKQEFTTTAQKLFENVNEKVVHDLEFRSTKVNREAGRVSLRDVFVDPMRDKTREEIEAEKLLMDYFEEQILDFNEQVKSDFERINAEMSKSVGTAKANFANTIQDYTPKELPKIKSLEEQDTQTFSNLPSKSAVKENFGRLLEKTGQDFQVVQKRMQEDVAKRQEKISKSANYYADKLFGKTQSFCDDDEA